MPLGGVARTYFGPAALPFECTRVLHGYATRILELTLCESSAMQIASWLGRGRLPETCWLTGARSGVPAPGLRHPGSGLLRCPNCGLLARSARVTLERDLRTAGLSADQLQTAHDPARIRRDK